jgi:hypothetical protein
MRGVLTQNAVTAGPRRLLTTGLLLAIVCGSGAACSSTRAATPQASTVASSTGSKPSPEPSGTASRPPDPIVKTVPPVQRKGAKPASQRLNSPAAAFTGQVRYTDGVTLQVLSIAQGTSSGKGPGVFVGSPRTALTIKVTNDTSRPLALNGVVVSLLYGTPQRMASPVYEDSAHDLAGTVAAGKSATAVYMFSVPTKELSQVTMTVDFDGTHAAAVFRGSVKS